MYPRVRSTGSVEFEFSGRRCLAERAFDLALHRPRVLLHLPAAIAGARVLDGQLEPHVRPIVSGIISAVCNRPMIRRLPIGAEVQPDGSTHFRVWAPDPRNVTLVLE